MYQTRYKQGLPCGKCGGTTRYLSDRCCVPCSKAKRAKWRKDNPEQQIVGLRKWKTENREYSLQENRNYRVAFREYLNMQSRVWRQDNKEYAMLSQRERRAKP